MISSDEVIAQKIMRLRFFILNFQELTGIKKVNLSDTKPGELGLEPEHS